MDLYHRLSHVHSDVRDLVLRQCGQHRDEHFAHDIGRDHCGECGHAEQGRESVQVVLVHVQTQQFGDGMGGRPLHAEDLRQLLQVVDGGLPDRVDAVIKPRYANGTQLVVEEGLAQLSSQNREQFHHRQLDPPVLVLTQLSQRGYDRLRQVLDAQHLVQVFQPFEQVESHIRAFIPEQSQEHWEDVLVSGGLLDYRTQSQKVLGQGAPHILESVSLQLLKARHYLAHDAGRVQDLAEVR